MGKVLSPLGGAGAQFFDADGLPLAGGLLYTYAAGTTTPQAAYTTSVGDVVHPNPIVLDAAGRVPGGQVWLNEAGYKFVLTDSLDATVATWDNLAVPDAANTPFSPPTGSTLAGKTTVDAALIALASVATVALPAGSITMYGGATVPDGWLVCDGSVKVGTDYPDLFAAIGNTHNTGGEAAGSFRLPDLRGRAPIGVGAGTSLTERTLGAKGGAETHTLSGLETPGHAHFLPVPTGNYLTETGTDRAPLNTGGLDDTNSILIGRSALSNQTDFFGENGAHNNMQPFLAVNFIIKT